MLANASVCGQSSGSRFGSYFDFFGFSQHAAVFTYGLPQIRHRNCTSVLSLMLCALQINQERPD